MNTAGINRELQLMGLSPKHKGFFFLGQIVSSMDGVADEKLPETYSAVCGSFEHGRRVSERCMFYAISYAWKIMNGSIHDLFPGRADEPSPMELAFAIHWELKRRGGSVHAQPAYAKPTPQNDPVR